MIHDVGGLWEFRPGVGLWGRGVADVGCIVGMCFHVVPANICGYRWVALRGDVGGDAWCMEVLAVGWHFVGILVDCVDVVMGKSTLL